MVVEAGKNSDARMFKKERETAVWAIR